MAIRYNNDRVLVAGDVKARLLVAVCRTITASKKQEPNWSDLRAQNVTWEELCGYKLLDFGSFASAEAQRKQPVAAEVASSSDSSSTSSSEASGDSDLENIVEWFQQPNSSTIHVMQKVQDSALVPWRRSGPFGHVHSVRGSGTEVGMRWCTKCLERCPLATRRAINVHSAIAP